MDRSVDGPGGWSLAIDFGTSNTAAAVTGPDGRPVAMPLGHSGTLMPSAVFRTPTGEIEVGDAALAAAAAAPQNLLPSPKRAIDHDRVPLGGGDVPVDELVGAVLGRAISEAFRRHDGVPPREVVLTHPEAWTPATIERLVRSADRAGVPRDRIRLVSEPRAAAHFHAGGTAADPGSRVAVFDFGGGTLDVAVLEAGADGDFRVVSATGDNSLGGRNVDVAIRRWLDAWLADEYPGVSDRLRESAPPRVRLRLDESIRSAKEVLSQAPSADIAVETPEGVLSVRLDRATFEQIVTPEIDRAVRLTRTALERAGGDPAATTVYLTGGSSRIPLVRAGLEKVARVATLDDPKTVVARGALLAPALDAAGRAAAPPPGARGGGASSPGSSAASSPSSPGDSPAVSGRRRWLIGAAIAAIVVLVAATLAAVLLPGDEGPEYTTTPPGTGVTGVEGLPDALAPWIPRPLVVSTAACVRSDGGVYGWDAGHVALHHSCGYDVSPGITLPETYSAMHYQVLDDEHFAQVVEGAAADDRTVVLQEAGRDTPRVVSRHDDVLGLWTVAMVWPGPHVTVLSDDLTSADQAAAFARDAGMLS